MFQNLYSASRYMSSIKTRPSVKLNGIDLQAFGFMLTEMPNLFLPPIRERTIQLDNQSGSLDMGALYDNWAFTISGQIMGLTHEDLVNKSNELKRWLDVQQHRQSDFVVNQEQVRGLTFELAGDTIWYSDGTVAVTNGSALITGTGTSYISYAKSGALFEVEGDTTKYGVLDVRSDTLLDLTANISRSTASGLKYRLERRKYLIVNYNGESTLTSFSSSGFLSQSKVGTTTTNQASNFMNLVIGFRTTYPYWLGDLFEDSRSTVAQNSFIEMKGIGTGMLVPRIQVKGVANTPKVVEATYGFHCRFDGTLIGTDTSNANNTGSYTVGTKSYRPAKRGFGALVDSGDTLFFDTVLVNKDQFSFICRFRPQTASTSMAADGYVFDLFKDTVSRTDSFFARFDFTNDTWTFGVRVGSSDTVLTTANNIARFNADEEIELSGWFNVNGIVDNKDGTTYYQKLMFNGEIVASQTSPISAPAVNLVDLIVGSRFNTSGPVTGTLHFNAVFSELALFNISLSDEELRKSYNQKFYLVNTNIATTISINMGADDVVDLDPSFTHRSYDSSDNLVASAITSVTGYPLVLRGTEKERAVLMVSTASGTVEVLKLVYYPIFR